MAFERGLSGFSGTSRVSVPYVFTKLTKTSPVATLASSKMYMPTDLRSQSYPVDAGVTPMANEIDSGSEYYPVAPDMSYPATRTYQPPVSMQTRDYSSIQSSSPSWPEVDKSISPDMATEAAVSTDQAEPGLMDKAATMLNVSKGNLIVGGVAAAAIAGWWFLGRKPKS